MATYTDAADVRRNTGGFIPEDVDDNQLLEYADAAEDWLNSEMQVEVSYPSNHFKFKSMQQIAKLMGAVFALQEGGEASQTEAENKRRLVVEVLLPSLLKALGILGAEEVGEDEIIGASAEYGSYPMALEDNPDAQPYLSTTGYGTLKTLGYGDKFDQ